MPYWSINNYFYNIRMVLNLKFQQEDLETRKVFNLFLDFLFNEILNDINQVFTEQELKYKFGKFKENLSKSQDEQFITILKNKRECNKFLFPMEERLLELLEEKKFRL